MSKYIKLDDAINAYNQAVKELVEEEMNEFDLCHFTECSFNTTQIMLIARMIESLPTIEVSARTGEWIKNKNGTYSCSECHSWLPEEQHHYARYCLYCGAKMGGDTE